MKFTADRALLSAALATCARIVDRRTSIPILANVKLTATDSALSIVSTDLDMQIEAHVPANVETDGAITVPAQIFSAFVARGSADSISFEVLDTVALVRCGRARANLPTLTANDFPTLEMPTWDHRFVMVGERLGSALSGCMFAASRDASKPHLGGVCIRMADDGLALHAAASDGNSISVVERELPLGAEKIDGFVLPLRACAEIVRLCASDVEVSASSRLVRFDFGQVVLATKLIETRFVSYASVIATRGDKSIKVNRADLLGAIERVALAAEDNDRCIKFTVEPGHLKIEQRSCDRGHVVEDLDVETSDSGVVGFSSAYLRNFLGALDGETVEFSAHDFHSPWLLRNAGQDMPVSGMAPMVVR